MGRVHVRLFSLLRERAGQKDVHVDVPDPATVQDVLQGLAQTIPGLRTTLHDHPDLVRVSVNRAHADREASVRDGDEIAVFPPVSGGAPDRGLLLLSGGFDSPVAGRLTLDQGFGLDAVHYSFQPFTDDASERKAVQLAHQLGLEAVTIVPLGAALAHVAKTCQPRAYFVLQKRLMVRIADALADRTGARFLVTGENLGQVSSQTLANLGAIDAVARHPILRPLLGWDKHEIVDEARRIGTYETSCGPEVCDVLGPDRPDTGVRLDRAVAEEARVDMDALVRDALAGARVEAARADDAPRATAEAC